MWLDLGDYHGPGRPHALISYMIERTRARDIEAAYRIYVTDALNNIPQNKYMQRRFADLIKPKAHVNIDPEQVIANVAKLGGLEVI